MQTTTHTPMNHPQGPYPNPQPGYYPPSQPQGFIQTTVDEKNSVTVSQDAKGVFRFEVKVYFGGPESQADALERTEQMYHELAARFPNPQPVDPKK